MDNDPWRETFEQILKQTVTMPGESADDALHGAYAIGQRRSRVLGREIRTAEDVPFALISWCWWPFKLDGPTPAREAIRKARPIVFGGVAKLSPDDAEKRLAEYMPEELLRLSLAELMTRVEKGSVLELLRLPRVA